MNKIFPESLNELPPDPVDAVKVLENYIRYMSERIDHAFATKTARDIPFDKKDTGLTSNNVHDAILEIRRLNNG